MFNYQEHGGVRYWDGYGYAAPVNKVSETDPAVEAALNEVAEAMCSKHFSVEEALASDKPLRYIMGYNGVHVMRSEILNGNRVSITTKATKIPGAPMIPDSLELNITEKIPKEILTKFITAFKAVYDRDSTESAGQLYRDRETKEYFLYFPTQVNTGASSEYKADKLATESLRTTMDFILEAHSHASMGAFFSGTDDANENLLLFYFVLGNFNTKKCSFTARLKVGSTSKMLKIDDIFEGATDADLSLEDLPADESDILEKATKKTFTYATPVRGTDGRFLPIPANKPPTPVVSPINNWSLRTPSSSGSKLDVAWFTKVMTHEELLELKKHVEGRLAEDNGNGTQAQASD